MLTRVRNLDDALGRLMTPKQKIVFLCIDEFWKKMGYRPSVDDIMRLTGDRGRGNVNRVMRKLVDLGVCKHLPGSARSIRPVYVNFRRLE